MASVLVVDDEPLIRETLRQILEHAGHEVTDVGNGKEALSALSGRTFDLVITDILMPEKEGIETIIEIKSQMPNLAIIAISGGDRAGAMDVLGIARRLGANQVLAKPFRGEQILNAVEAALGPAD